MKRQITESKIRKWVTNADLRKGELVFEQKASRYQICSRCIMDTSDPEIIFNEQGICNHCDGYDATIRKSLFQGEEGVRRLNETLEIIKREGKGKKYDCIVGLSGGVDSTYVAYLCKKVYGLRPLAVHLDNGWNSEIAVRNIQNIIETLDIDLYTEVLRWDEFKSLQVSFLKSSTPDGEIPTDHAIAATLFNQAKKHNVRWIMDGLNAATEMMMPATWSYGHADWRYIQKIHKMFGDKKKLKSFPHYSYFQYLIEYPHLRKLMRFPILNYVDFNKTEAMEILKKELNWQPYGGKHYESIYTRFFQGYILPVKFGFDKRRPHLSCLIKSGLMTREEALRQMQSPAIDQELLGQDKPFVIKKLGLTEQQFAQIMQKERKTFWDFPSYESIIRRAPVKLLSFMARIFLP